ncbi:hypothetical protein L873DRAFT_1799671 [Choiromyces venosus 120613-1]|uniref:Uncharacterized protein n=1 Tax=Choiromyces venosus 120613-1 TaxID=1336337 RepID=A0A3N4K4R2_9PEZI|nr:hypothetical protein L873DRAFT_1799671 [Choiromyces venosus 120613-1]
MIVNKLDGTVPRYMYQKSFGMSGGFAHFVRVMRGLVFVRERKKEREGKKKKKEKEKRKKLRMKKKKKKKKDKKKKHRQRSKANPPLYPN